MKSNGVFRVVAKAFATALSGFNLWWKGTKSYPDPIFRDKYTKKRKGTRIPGKFGKPRLGRPACDPGTYTHHDWLVRHLGYDRRKADGWIYAFQNYGVDIPTPGMIDEQKKS